MTRSTNFAKAGSTARSTSRNAPRTTAPISTISAVPITPGPTFSAGTPQKLFEGRYLAPYSARTYDVAPDGQRFYATQLAAAPPLPAVTHINLIQNWFEELKARIAKTVALIETFKPAQIDGSEDREVVLKLQGNEVKFRGLQYLLGFAWPNFYFHATTAYAILRHNGVELGKRDFIGNP